MPSKGAKTVITLFIGLMVGGMLLGPLNAAVAANTGIQTVTNESVTADTSEYVDLTGHDIVSNSETVYWLNSSSGSYEEVQATGNYTLKEKPGQIRANASGLISDGDSLKVSYEYAATNQNATTIASMAITLVVVMLIWIPARWIQENS